MPEPVNCVWAEGSLEVDNRSRYATNTLLNNALDKANVGFIHRNGLKELPADAEGCVVIIHGEHMANRVEELLEWMHPLLWVLIVIMGDESRIFKSDRFVRARRKIWRQYPVPGMHDFENRRMVAGYPADCPGYLEHLQQEIAQKPLDWCFMGQVNNRSRQECVTQLKMISRGYLYQSPGFWQGLPRDEYYKRLAESKVVACPAGGAFPESLRAFEALEAGCVPVLENKQFGAIGYWEYVFGERPPVPILSHWSDFPRYLDETLRDWPASRDRAQAWWQGYKAKLPTWFEEDINAIR